MAEEKTTESNGWFNLNLVGLLLVIGATLVSIVQVLSVEQQIDNPNEIQVRIAHWQLEAGYREAMAHVIEQYQLAVNGPYVDQKYNDPANIPTNYNDKLQWLRDVEYQGPYKFGKTVRVIQMGVAERVYPQWVNTRLISRDAPDLIEIGKGTMAKNEEYLARFFLSVTDATARPNPYNAIYGADGPNSLEGLPWRETFIDGNRGAFYGKVQEYLGVATTIYPTRLYVNQKLLREAKKLLLAEGKLPETWRDRRIDQAEDPATAPYATLDDYSDPNALIRAVPPRTFGELMLVCNRMQLMETLPEGGYRPLDPGEDSRRRVIPIAGSAYGVTGEFLKRYAVAFQAHLAGMLDLNQDGYPNGTENYQAYHRNQISMMSPEVKRYWFCVRDLCKQFGKGFFGQDRQSATFNFVQGKAGMICTGSWEASGLIRGGKRNGFEVEIIDFPLPGPGEQYYDAITGKEYAGVRASMGEAGQTGGGIYGVYKFSHHPDIAIDFLQFITSQYWNGEFTSRAELLPAIHGAKILDIMKPFMPDPEGFHNNARWYISNDIWEPLNRETLTKQWPYLQGDTATELWAQKYEQKQKDLLEKAEKQLTGQELQQRQQEIRQQIQDELAEEAYQLFAKKYMEPLDDKNVGAKATLRDNIKKVMQQTRQLESQLAAYATQQIMIERLIAGTDPDAQIQRAERLRSLEEKYHKVLLQQIQKQNGASAMETYQALFNETPEID